MSIFKIIGFSIAVVIGVALVFVFLFVRACNKGELYQAGSGVGSLVDIDKEKYQSDYLQKYADTFFKAYPKYKLSPEQEQLRHSTSEVLDLTDIYFDEHPKEIYSVQWSGTGFISIRFAFDCENFQEITENTRLNSIIADSVKERIEKRFRKEVLNRIDSIISMSKDSTEAIRKPAF
jgi:hypothetical protein